MDRAGKVTRYNLTYINHAVFSGDNGRVIGDDNPMATTTGIALAV